MAKSSHKSKAKRRNYCLSIDDGPSPLRMMVPVTKLKKSNLNPETRDAQKNDTAKYSQDIFFALKIL